MNYAIVKTGGKQYRVQPGQSLLVERLRADEGAQVKLEPLLVRDGDKLVDGGDAAKATVSAKVVGHERGPKIRVLKFKPKRGYKRRTGHRQELTRLEVTEIKLGRSGGAARKPAAKAAGDKSAADEPAAGKTAARKPAASRARTKKEDADDGS